MIWFCELKARVNLFYFPCLRAEQTVATTTAGQRQRKRKERRHTDKEQERRKSQSVDMTVMGLIKGDI